MKEKEKERERGLLDGFAVRTFRSRFFDDERFLLFSCIYVRSCIHSYSRVVGHSRMMLSKHALANTPVNVIINKRDVARLVLEAFYNE